MTKDRQNINSQTTTAIAAIKKGATYTFSNEGQFNPTKAIFPASDFSPFPLHIQGQDNTTTRLLPYSVATKEEGGKG